MPTPGGLSSTPPVSVVPTHGDWQPRNRLIKDDVVSVIDFGRAELLPSCRMARGRAEEAGVATIGDRAGDGVEAHRN